MIVSRDEYLKLANLEMSNFQKMAQRGQIPSLRRGKLMRASEAFDVLLFEVANDLARDAGFDRAPAAEIVYRAQRTLRAIAHEIDGNPSSNAFICVGFEDAKDNMDCWGGVLPLDELIANQVGGPYYRIVCIDVARAANRIRQRAKKHRIPLERFTELIEVIPGATAHHEGTAR